MIRPPALVLEVAWHRKDPDGVFINDLVGNRPGGERRAADRIGMGRKDVRYPLTVIAGDIFTTDVRYVNVGQLVLFQGRLNIGWRAILQQVGVKDPVTQRGGVLRSLTGRGRLGIRSRRRIRSARRLTTAVASLAGRLAGRGLGSQLALAGLRLIVGITTRRQPHT